jgi:hypothetical protein
MIGMKTEYELNHDILNITMAIEEKFPELSKYITETPVDISLSTTPEMNIKGLQDYYDSLDNLLNHYNKNHSAITK